MGATYTRQSTYADGDTINAADSNDEFDQLLAAFASSTGHTHDGTAGEGGPISSLISNTITFGTGADTDVAVTFNANTTDGVLTWMEDEDYFQFSDDILMSTTEKLQFRDTAIYINSSADGQLDLVADTEVQIAATTIDVNGNLDVSGTVVGASTISAGTAFVPDASDGAALGTTSLEFSDLFLADAAVINLGADQDVTLTHVADTGVLLNAASVIQFRDSAINIGSPTDGDLDINADDEIELNSTLIDINGNVDISGTSTLTGDVTLGGKLIMPTVTSGHILVADGTSFEEKAVGDLAEISTVANDDVFLAVDTSGGGLKKITRSAVVAGLATSGAITDIVEDTSPQLGGNLDTNSQNILIDDAHFIGDENGNEQIIFQTTSSAVNQFDVTNAATGSGPQLSATGGDSNVDLDLLAKGTGHVTVRGNTNSGAIQFNCESNSHGQLIQAQPHSAGVTNTMLLPAGADSTLVSLVSTDTLTNKTLTSPVINTGTFGTSILPVSADGTTLGSASKEFSDLFLADGGTIQFGNDQDTTLTHTDGTGLTLNSTNKLCFNDASQFIQGASATVLDIAATDEIELTATLIDVVGNFTNSGTIVSAGKITSDAGIDIDNFNIDGTTIALSSGDMTLDGAADIILDAAGDEVIFKDGSTNVGHVSMDSDNLTIKSLVSDKDVIFQGNDGGSGITALTLDMSAAGAATFNNDVTAFSDKRLKTDVTDIENALDKVQQMQGVYYRRNDVENAKMQVGVLAQDMEQILPEVVLTADDEMQTKSVDYGKITSVLIEAVKELSAKVEYLEGKKECSCGGDK